VHHDRRSHRHNEIGQLKLEDRPVEPFNPLDHLRLRRPALALHPEPYKGEVLDIIEAFDHPHSLVDSQRILLAYRELDLHPRPQEAETTSAPTSCDAPARGRS